LIARAARLGFGGARGGGLIDTLST
jgi:hypothetical protein